MRTIDVFARSLSGSRGSSRRSALEEERADRSYAASDYRAAPSDDQPPLRSVPSWFIFGELDHSHPDETAQLVLEAAHAASVSPRH